jgi:2-polyprenyl-3-methyl-5-hydroxy-6-metoxy-1,4-benzoquinol methylase
MFLMSNTERVDKTLFKNEHYLGKPAEADDKIISRRIEIIESFPEFFGPSLSCIEVGCGAGVTINRVAHRFSDVLGIDIYDYANAFEQQRRKYNATNSAFKQLDLEETPIDKKFDRLISFEVIEHLTSEGSVAAYADLLKKNGLAAITVPNKWWIFETHGARLPVLPWNRVPFFSWLPTFIHERFANARIYTPGRIKRLLEQHGFHIESCLYVTAPMDVLKEGRLKRMLVKYVFKSNTTKVPTLATSIFIMARKK